MPEAKSHADDTIDQRHSDLSRADGSHSTQNLFPLITPYDDGPLIFAATKRSCSRSIVRAIFVFSVLFCIVSVFFFFFCQRMHTSLSKQAYDVYNRKFRGNGESAGERHM